MANPSAVNENTCQIVDNVRNYAIIFFFYIVEPHLPLHVSVGCHVYMQQQKTTFMNFYANTYFCIMHMKQQLS